MAIGRTKPARVVGRYQLVTELSTSYLGPLWAVRVDGDAATPQLAMLRLVALSRLDADTRVRLLEAAWQAMEVRDERICSVTDVVASDGELSIVSDYSEGLPLRALQGLSSVRRKPMPITVALRVVTDLVDAVVALHRSAIDLGDEAVSLFGGVSTDSVFVGTNGRASLLDVAIAGSASSVPSFGAHPERVAYAAPEQVSAEPRSNVQTDVFAVGIIAWELFAGRRLFVGSDKIVAQKVLATKIPKIDELRRKGDPEIPAPLLAVVMRALERDPANRFATMEEFARTLAAARVAPADATEVGAYVSMVAEGALARTRDALKEPAAKDKAPWAKLKPPETAAKQPGPAFDPKVAAAFAPVAPPRSLSPYPSPPKAVLGARPRQPTMIGIPPPSRSEAEAAARLMNFVAANPEAANPSLEEGAVTARQVHEPSPEAIDALRESIESLMPEPSAGDAPLPRRELQPSLSEEPTGQYNARDLLTQVEAMGRKSDPARHPPTDFPEPTTDELIARPTAQFAQPDTAALTQLAAQDDWLDDPEPAPTVPTGTEQRFEPAIESLDSIDAEEIDSLARPPVERAPEPVRVAPRQEPRELSAAAHEHLVQNNAAADGRVAERQALTNLPAPTASTPFIPSQMPPPLLHDPRARHGRSMAPREERAPRRKPSIALGIAMCFGLIVVSAAVAIIALRSRGADADAPLAVPVATTALPLPVVATVAAPVVTAPTVSADAHVPGSPEPSALAAATALAAAPAPPATGTETTTAVVAPAVAPRAPVVAAAHPSSNAPARAAAPRKKKRSRFVPDDI